jgi:hypothetical protein
MLESEGTWHDQIHEWLRQAFLRDLGPIIISNIIGASAPPGGPFPLSFLVAEARWRLPLPDDDEVNATTPSVFELPKRGVLPIFNTPPPSLRPSPQQ